jgi:hypothetical protein
VVTETPRQFMNKGGTAVQVALIVGAILLGVLLDRVLFAGGGAVRSDSSREAGSTSSGSVAADAPSQSPSSYPARARDVRLAAPTSEPVAADSTATSLDSILEQRDPRQRLRDLQAFIQNVPASGYADALKRIRQITSSNERELASRLLVAQWVQTDPDGALQFAAGNRGYEYVAEDVFHHFASNDFTGSMERAKGIPGNELRYRALRGILSFKADTDPRAAIQLAQELGDFRGYEPLASVVYRQWAANDPQAAASAASGDGQAAGWRSPIAPVVQTWAQQDPAAAANWSLTLGDARAQERSIAQVMRQWTREDPTAAANWIHGLDAGTSRDAAVAGLAQSLVYRDPQTALGWIGTINDDAARTRALQRVSGIVMWRDPQNGAAMLQAAGLPADQIRSGRRWREP